MKRLPLRRFAPGLVLLTASGCVLSSVPRSKEVLRTAETAMGSEEDLDRIETLRAVAECRGPAGPYRAELQSARGGHLHFALGPEGEQETVAVVHGDQAWRLTDQGAEPLTPAEALRVVGHDFAMIALDFPRRFPRSRVEGLDYFGGRPCVVLGFSTQRGQPAKAYFHEGSGLLAGFTLEDDPGAVGGGPVVVRILAWQAVDDVRLPGMVVVTDAEGERVLFFRSIEINGADPSALEPPEPPEPPEPLGPGQIEGTPSGP